MRELTNLINFMLVLSLFIQSAAAGTICDDYVSNIKNDQAAINERTSDNVVQIFCSNLKESSEENYKLMTFCETGEYPKFSELKRLYNEALSRTFVLNGLREIKKDFEQQEIDVVNTREEKLGTIKEKYKTFKDTLTRAQLLESSFADVVFLKDPKDTKSKKTKGSPYMAYINFLNKSNTNSKKHIPDNIEMFNKYTKDYLCADTANTKGFCKILTNEDTTDDHKKVLYDLYKTRYQFEGSDGNKKDMPSLDDLRFAKEYSDDIKLREKFSNALKIDEGVKGTEKISIANYKTKYLDKLESAIETYDNSSSKENRAELVKQLSDVATNSNFVTEMKVNRVDIEESLVEALHKQNEKANSKIKKNGDSKRRLQKDDRKYRINKSYEEFHKGITGRDEDQARGETENTLAKVINNYEEFQKTTNRDLKDVEPTLKRALVGKLIGKFNSHQEAAYQELHSNSKVQQTAELKKARQTILDKNKSCLEDAKSVDEYGKELKGFDEIATCMLGDYYKGQEELDAQYQESTNNYNLYKSLMKQIESDSDFIKLEKKKEARVIEYMEVCKRRFELVDRSYSLTPCDNKLPENTVDETLTELIDDYGNVSIFITNALVKKIKDDSEIMKNNIKSKPDVETDVETDVENNNRDKDNEEEDNDDDDDSSGITVLEEDYYGQNNYQMSTLDAIVQGSFQGASAMGPSMLRYRQMQAQSQMAMQDARYRQNQYYMNRFSPYPSYRPTINNGFMSNMTYNSGLYFRGAQSPNYYYNSTNQNYLYNGLSSTYGPNSSFYGSGGSSYLRSATGVGALNIPVNFSR